MRDARVLGHPVQVAVGQQPLRERGEHDRADPLALEDVEQLLLDPAVEHASTTAGGSAAACPSSRRISAASSVRRGP